MFTVKSKLSVTTVARGRKKIHATRESDSNPRPHRKGRIPRIAKLMALAIRFNEMLRTGDVRDLVELAELGHVSQPRMTQIMALNLLAPDIQEALLNLPVETGKPLIHEKRLRSLTTILDWDVQRAEWLRLNSKAVDV